MLCVSPFEPIKCCYSFDCSFIHLFIFLFVYILSLSKKKKMLDKNVTKLRTNSTCSINKIKMKSGD